MWRASHLLFSAVWGGCVAARQLLPLRVLRGSMRVCGTHHSRGLFCRAGTRILRSGFLRGLGLLRRGGLVCAIVSVGRNSASTRACIPRVGIHILCRSWAWGGVPLVGSPDEKLNIAVVRWPAGCSEVPPPPGGDCVCAVVSRWLVGGLFGVAGFLTRPLAGYANEGPA